MNSFVVDVYVWDDYDDDYYWTIYDDLNCYGVDFAVVVDDDGVVDVLYDYLLIVYDVYYLFYYDVDLILLIIQGLIKMTRKIKFFFFFKNKTY